MSMGRVYLDAIWKAIQTETETDTLICQIQAVKEILDEIGAGFLSKEAVDGLAKQLIDMYHKSDERIKENNMMAKNEEAEDEDDELDDDEKEVIKEENRNEYDLQLSIAEVLGVIFKTHRDLCANVLQELFASILPVALASEEKQKLKFGIYVMVDLLEFVGADLLGAHYASVAKEIIKFCGHPISAIRQAASYGIGIMAEKGGASYQMIATECMQGLQVAIEYQMTAGVKEKKTKVKQFMHAKDNAVAALGKIIRYQSATINAAQIIPNWLGLLPIKHDIEESKLQNEILASLLQDSPLLILGEQYQHFELVVLILSEVMQKKYLNEETGVKLARIVQHLAQDAVMGPHFKAIFENKLTVEAKERLENALKFA